MTKITPGSMEASSSPLPAQPALKLEREWDDCTEEEGMAEYEEFKRCLEEDEVLGPSWRHAQTSRGWR